MWYIKIRLMPGVPFRCNGCQRVLVHPGVCSHCGTGNKYRGVKGNRVALLGADRLTGKPNVFVTEGDFDAMLLHQIAGDLIDVLTLGSANARLTDYWLPYLLAGQRFYIATDNDTDGDKAADHWLDLVKDRGVRVHPPRGKDVTESWQAGVDLRLWVKGCMGILEQ